MIGAYLAVACRFYVLLVLVAAVAGKATAIADFRQTVGDLFGLSGRWAIGGALGVVCAEALIALALMIGGARAQAGMAAAMLLFAVFAAVILVALIQRRAVLCNCFGGRSHLISAYDLLRNAILVGACGFALRFAPPGHVLDPAAYLLLLGVAIILLLVSAGLGDIARLAR